MNDWLPVVVAVLLSGVGGAALLWICQRGRDVDTDPFRLADRAGDGPELDLARAVGVVPVDGWLAREADGSHDNLDVDEPQWAAELMWLYESMPEAVLLDGPTEVDDPWASPERAERTPPIVPGRDNP